MRLSLFQVWASKEARPTPIPKALEKHRRFLEEKIRLGKIPFKSFRVEGKEVVKTVGEGESSDHKLSELYSLSLTPERQRDKLVLRYELKKKGTRWSELTLLPSGKPNLVVLPIERGKEQLVLLLVCERAKGE